MPKYALFFSVTFALSLSSCHQESTDAADTKTLNNFAGSDFQWNVCRGSYPTSESKIDVTQPESKYISEALTAVPPSWQRLFFRDMSGSIRVTNDIATACREPAGHSNGSSALTFCSVALEDGSHVIILAGQDGDLGAAKRIIDHTVVRAMAEIVSRKLDATDAGRTIKAQVALALIEDVASDTSGAYSLNRFEGFLPKSVLQAKTPGERLSAYQALSRSDLELFELFSFAEAYDSRYCSESSRILLAKDFTRVTRVLLDEDKTVEKLIAGTSGLSLQNAPGSSGRQNFGYYSQPYATWNQAGQSAQSGYRPVYQQSYRPSYRPAYSPCLWGGEPNSSGRNNFGGFSTNPFRQWSPGC